MNKSPSQNGTSFWISFIFSENNVILFMELFDLKFRLKK